MKSLVVIIAGISFLFLFVYCTKSVDKPQSLSLAKQERSLPVTFLIYGELAPEDYAKPEDSIRTKKFGFKIERVSGCDITTSLEDSIITHNRESDMVLKNKYGENWKEQFTQKEKLKLSLPL